MAFTSGACHRVLTPKCPVASALELNSSLKRLEIGTPKRADAGSMTDTGVKALRSAWEHRSARKKKLKASPRTPRGGTDFADPAAKGPPPRRREATAFPTPSGEPWTPQPNEGSDPRRLFR